MAHNGIRPSLMPCVQVSPDRKVVLRERVDASISAFIAHYSVIMPKGALTPASLNKLLYHKDNKLAGDIRELCCKQPVPTLHEPGSSFGIWWSFAPLETADPPQRCQINWNHSQTSIAINVLVCMIRLSVYPSLPQCIAFAMYHACHVASYQ
jgi:hypothetical protein